MKIWCVEDDESIRDIEVYTLNSTGFEAEGFPDAAPFREALLKKKPDLILLDIMLPGEDGVELLKFLKDSPDTCMIPVIMATAKGMEYDKIQSLDLGADDYLVKPFGMMEMVSRVKAVLRRCKSVQVQHLLKTGGLVVNLDEYTVTIDDERIK
ncbi:MAG: response regulator transcription factor, partial [Butyrivibrio sp.]|nr:response regulator transcription factor [Butyrivibrio sp.]